MSKVAGMPSVVTFQEIEDRELFVDINNHKMIHCKLPWFENSSGATCNAICVDSFSLKCFSHDMKVYRAEQTVEASYKIV
jgi:hypothetical protein